MIDGDPRHKVDNKLIIVETLAVFFPSLGVFPADETPVAPAVVLDVLVAVAFTEVPKELDILANKSLSNPCSANGAGSTPRRVNRSERDAKQRNAPSATYWKCCI